MRYTTECSDRPKYFGFYARLLEDKGETALYDQAYDHALKGTGRRAISNREFLTKMMNRFIETTSGVEQ
jgi:hypothetical protein